MLVQSVLTSLNMGTVNGSRNGQSDLDRNDTDLARPKTLTEQVLSLFDTAERKHGGPRYRTPRLAREDVMNLPTYASGIASLSDAMERTEQSIAREAERDLREIVAGGSPTMLRVAASLGRFILSQGYDSHLSYDAKELGRIAQLGREYPLVFLPSHKSYLDGLVLRSALHENSLPQTQLAAGANLDFFPLGTIYRRAGAFFIRRSFHDDEIYKFVLRQYIDYLLENRYTLEWYIEGGRSRTGKLMPPRYGLLSYVVSTYMRSIVPDVYLVPTSIVYDQLGDVSAVTAEQHGARKKPEGLSFALRYIHRLRRRFGAVTIRFGEPLSLRKELGPPPPLHAPQGNGRPAFVGGSSGKKEVLPAPTEGSSSDPAGSARPTDTEPDSHLQVQKLAFEVMVRINQATPITPTSLMTLAMLGSGDRALSVTQLMARLEDYSTYVEARKLPTTGSLEFNEPREVLATLELLMEHDVVTCFTEGLEPVYAIGPDQHLSAAYYRNSILHFFLTGAIAELALLNVANPEVEATRDEFWDSAFALRDLLKFEFFFADKDAFRTDVETELTLHDPDWQARIVSGPTGVFDVANRVRPLRAHAILRSFLEAYQVAGDILGRQNPTENISEGPFVDRCLRLGRQYLLQRQIRSAESVSKTLFLNALALARNRGLDDITSPDLVAGRQAFAYEIHQWVGLIDRVEALAGLTPS